MARGTSVPVTRLWIQISNSRAEAPVLFEAPGAPLVFSLAGQSEGDGAPGGAACKVVRALLAKSAAPTGAPPEDFSSGLFAAFSPASGPAFRTEALASGSASSWQGTLVSPGGAPTPPGAQGRRSLETQAPHLAPSTDVTG